MVEVPEVNYPVAYSTHPIAKWSLGRFQAVDSLIEIRNEEEHRELIELLQGIPIRFRRQCVMVDTISALRVQLDQAQMNSVGAHQGPAHSEMNRKVIPQNPGQTVDQQGNDLGSNPVTGGDTEAELMQAVKDAGGLKMNLKPTGK